jgi:PAS domain S-box-containing protein
VRQQRSDGSWVDLDMRVDPYRDAQGRLAGFFSVSRDITGRKVAERALRESEERYRSVVAAIGEGIVMRQADGTLSACNPAAERILGATASQLEGLAPTDPGWYTLREDGTPLAVEDRPARISLRTGKPQEDQVLGVHRPDGTVAWVSCNSQPLLRDGESSPFAVVSTYKDVTKERFAAEALAHSEERLRLAFAAALQVEWEYDVARQVLRGATFTEGPSERGACEPAARSFDEQIHPDDRARTRAQLEACLKGQTPMYEAEHRLEKPGGGWRWVRSRGRITERDAQGRPLRLLGTLMDVTEVHALQEQLLAATRFASVGTLAAGVAHEVNNPLAWVTSNVSYALERLTAAGEAPLTPERRSELRELLDEALQGARRIRDIVKAMRSLGRPESSEPMSAVDVRAELLNALQMVGNQLAQRARVEVDVPEKLPLARAKTHELGRVFLNLLVNAAQAIPEGRSSLNRIGVRAQVKGGEIAVSIQDTGVGLSPSVRERIFDPFFTSKPVGVGTGLGLTIARSIVEGAQGRIEVDSEEGHGATFRVVLPALRPEEAGAPERGEASAPASARLRVLIVDDEPLIGRSLKRLLRETHEVTALPSAGEALSRLDAGERWDAILCDFMMPDIDGIGFYEAVAARYPSLLPRLAFMSGGVFGERASAFLATHEILVVPKPIEREALLGLLEKLH